MKIFYEHRVKHIFARAINRRCKPFCDGAGEGNRPREMKRPATARKIEIVLINSNGISKFSS